MRECGLKQEVTNTNLTADKSLPMRECGLKQIGRAVIILCREVTPHAGVWIETYRHWRTPSV